MVFWWHEAVVRWATAHLLMVMGVADVLGYWPVWVGGGGNRCDRPLGSHLRSGTRAWAPLAGGCHLWPPRQARDGPGRVSADSDWGP